MSQSLQAATPPARCPAPPWPDRGQAKRVAARLRALPPLVEAHERERLQGRLAQAARGEAFVLQAGECAEPFSATTPSAVLATRTLLVDMAAVLRPAVGVPVVPVARFAGQFAKPRSSPTEVRGEVELPSFMGAAVNDVAYEPEARRPDPRRMLDAYAHAARALAAARWLERRDGQTLFASHEAYLLDYERSLVRTVHGRAYPSSGHFLWIGDRTRDATGDHVAFLAGLPGPIGVKIGPTAAGGDIAALLERLDPERRPGRLTFIARLGARTVRSALPPLLERAAAEGSCSGWMCDPMHANTITSPCGRKTRRFADVVDELSGFVDVHEALGVPAAGVHLEVTTAPVTECVGGTAGPREDELHRRYDTACDPRLNRGQALELAIRAAAVLGRRRARSSAQAFQELSA